MENLDASICRRAAFRYWAPFSARPRSAPRRQSRRRAKAAPRRAGRDWDRGPWSRCRSPPRPCRRRGPADRRDAGGWSLRSTRLRNALLVPRKGLEPSRLAALVPETSASTNSATWARRGLGTEPLSACQLKRKPGVPTGPVQPAADPLLPGFRGPLPDIERERHDRTQHHSTPWSPSMAARAFSAAMWCGRWPSGTTASGWRCAGPNWPTICSRSAASARSTPCRPISATAPSVEAAARDAHVLINLVGILFERGRQRFERRPQLWRRAGGAGGERPWRAHGARLGDRRRREFAQPPTPAPRPRPNAWCWRRCRKPSSCGRRSCSGRRTISSTASPRWRASRRRCR